MKIINLPITKNIEDMYLKYIFDKMKNIINYNNILIHTEKFYLEPVNKYFKIEVYFLYQYYDHAQYVSTKRLTVIQEIEADKIVNVSAICDLYEFINTDSVVLFNMCTESNAKKISQLLKRHKVTDSIFKKHLSLKLLKSYLLKFNINVFFKKDTKKPSDKHLNLYYDVSNLFHKLIVYNVFKHNELKIKTDIDSFEFNYKLDIQDITFFNFFTYLFSMLKCKNVQNISLEKYFPNLELHYSEFNN